MAGVSNRNRPMGVSSMAQRLSFEERVWIEEMRASVVGGGEVARRLGRHPSTVYRELGRAAAPDYYCGTNCL